MRLTVLGIALLASASAIGEGYITSVRLPDGTTKTFQDAGARQEIQDILSQKYLKPESVKAGDNISVTTNEAGEVTIAADDSSPADYAIVSNAAMNALSRAEAKAGFTEWVVIPSEYEGKSLHIEWVRYEFDGSIHQGWAIVDSDGEERAAIKDYPTATNLVWSAVDTSIGAASATRTRLPTMADIPTAQINAATTTNALQDAELESLSDSISTLNDTKASKADATLTPIYSDTPTFSEWTGTVVDAENIVVTGSPYYQPFDDEHAESSGWYLPTSHQNLHLGVYDKDAVSLSFNAQVDDWYLNYTATRTRTDIIGYTLGSQTDKLIASEAEAEALRTAIAGKASESDVDPLLFAQYYPEGNVKSAAEFTSGIKYTLTSSATERTATAKPFCNTGNPNNDNSNLSGRVVIPPFVDSDGNGYISDDGTRYKVVGVSGGNGTDENPNLTAIVAPNTVTSIGDKAFITCTSLTAVALPGATIIGENAFTYCITLNSVDFGDSPREDVPTLGYDAFYEVPPTCTIIVPYTQYDEWIAADGWKDLQQDFVRHTENADKPATFSTGNLAKFDSQGNPIDSFIAATNIALKTDISPTDPAFSNAVLSVGLGIDTNTVAAINELVDSTHGLPVTGAASVGALLLALAAAIAALKRGKADKSDATLTPIYSDTPTFSKWTINPPGKFNEMKWLSEGGDYQWCFYSDDNQIYTANFDLNATSVSVKDNDGTIYTATRTRTGIIGYRLGSQSDKPLQPKGDYPTKAQMDSGWWSEWDVSPSDVELRWTDNQSEGIIGWSPYKNGFEWGNAKGDADSSSLSWADGVDASEAITATRHRVAAPVPTKPEDIGAAKCAPNPTDGNLAALDANGNPTDSQIPAANVATKGEIRYDLVTKTISNNAVTLDDRTFNKVTVADGITEVILNPPAEIPGKMRDFRLLLICGQNPPAITYGGYIIVVSEQDVNLPPPPGLNVYTFSEISRNQFIVTRKTPVVKSDNAPGTIESLTAAMAAMGYDTDGWTTLDDIRKALELPDTASIVDCVQKALYE